MLVDIDLSIAVKNNLTVNQYLLLKLVENSVELSKYKSVLNLTDLDIEGLKEKNLLLKASKLTDDLTQIYTRKKRTKDNDFFMEFYNLYPIYSNRPDGSKDYLRLYPNRCRKMYEDIVKLDESKHNFMLESLKRYIASKSATGKLGYIKNMYNWLQSGEYVEIMENVKLDKNIDFYGTEIE